MTTESVSRIGANVHCFSMEKPTQTEGKRLYIKQSNAGLEIVVGSGNNAHRVLPEMIQGLPKSELVPREFFNTCCARVATAGDEAKIYFTQPLMGGMMSSSSSTSSTSSSSSGNSNALSIRIADLPENRFQIAEFYQHPIIQQMIKSLKEVGVVKLGAAIEYTKAGADALSIAYLAGRGLPTCGVHLGAVKDQYSNLVVEMTASFISMQTNNLLVVQGHISAADFAEIGQLQEALDVLSKTQAGATKNIEICETLLARATSIREQITTCKKEMDQTHGELISIPNQMADIDKKLEVVRDRIRVFTQKETDALKQERSAEGKERLGKTLNALTFGLYEAVGGHTDYKGEIEMHRGKREEYYADLLVEKKLENQRIDEMSTLTQNISKLIGRENNPELACAAITMAQMGLDLVIQSLGSHRIFIEERKQQTEVTQKQLQDLLRLAKQMGFGEGQLPALDQMAKFEKRFRESAYTWIATAFFGDFCSRALSETQGDILARLQLRDVERDAQLATARKELTALQDVFAGRKKIGVMQQDAIENRINDPEGTAQQQKLLIDF